MSNEMSFAIRIAGGGGGALLLLSVVDVLVLLALPEKTGLLFLEIGVEGTVGLGGLLMFK
jgi:hypothetical protein